MEQELTDWFGPDMRPVHPGVYATEFVDGLDKGFSRWVGGRWGNQYSTPEAAAICGTAGAQNKRWRGLANKPEVNHG